MNAHFLLFIFLVFTTSSGAQHVKHQITGLVTDVNETPLPNVNIVIQNTNSGTTTGKSGQYAIKAQIGDTLVFTYIGLQSVTVLVEEIPAEIDVTMEKLDSDLEEVEVKARRLRTQAQLLKEYPQNKNLIKSSRGILDKRRMSGPIRIVEGKDLIYIGFDFLEALRNIVPNIARPIFEVDGMISFDPPPLVSSEIERIAILQRSSAILRYGWTEGDVIIINTKTQNEMDELGVDRSFEKKMLLDSMTIEATTFDDYNLFTSEYLEPFEKIRNRKQALAIHKEQVAKYRSNPYYFLDIYQCFSSKWDQEASRLYTEILDRFQDNVPVLKALAYMTEMKGDFESTIPLYLKILNKKPFQAQSHRDVALAYATTNDYKNALLRYNWFVESAAYLTKVPFNPYGQDFLMTTEMMNLLDLNEKEVVDSLGLQNENEFYSGTRIVLDWNHPNASLELQIINPDGYFDTWKNIESNPSDTAAAHLRYSCQQFFLDEEIKGKWILNLNYQGNQSDDPTYLKLTIFHNYGKPEQSKEVKVFRLSEKNKKIKLADIWN